MEYKHYNAQRGIRSIDIIEFACNRRRPVRAVLVDDAEEIIGISTPEHLQRAEMRCLKHPGREHFYLEAQGRHSSGKAE